MVAVSFAAANRCDSTTQRQASVRCGSCWLLAMVCVWAARSMPLLSQGCAEERCASKLAAGASALQHHPTLKNQPPTTHPHALPAHHPPILQMMTALAQRAEEVLPSFTPQGLANLAWG